MNTDELFALISADTDFKNYPHYRAIKHRHKNGILSLESYKKLFAHFGYDLKELTWQKKKSTGE